MKYIDMENLDEFRHILVTGPQRSGTTIAARMLAHDLGYKYVDERKVGVRSYAGLFSELNRDRCSIIQGPCYSSDCHWIDTEETAVVFMIRDTDDIEASQKRIDWQEEEIELANYYKNRGKIATVRYYAWHNFQKEAMRVPYFELDYESLSSHPLWIEKPERTEFHKRQWKLEEENAERKKNETTGDNNNSDLQPLLGCGEECPEPSKPELA